MNIDNILFKGPIEEAEEIFNKHHSQFDQTEQLLSIGIAMNHNKLKKETFIKMGDTHFGMKWSDFKKLLTAKGFTSAYSYNFKYKASDSTTIEEAIIMYHKEKGLVVWATSFFNQKDINGGTLYGEIKANNKESCNTIFKYLSSGGCFDKENLIYETSHDIREGLFTKLDILESAGTFLPVWQKKDRFLWFVDYVEDKKDGYDYEEITKNKIKKCSQELKNILKNMGDK